MYLNLAAERGNPDAHRRFGLESLNRTQSMPQNDDYLKGTEVILWGLTTRQDLNGKVGVVRRFVAT